MRLGEASIQGFKDGLSPPAVYDPRSVVTPLTVVNSQWKAQELERTATMQSGNSLGQVSTMLKANGRHHVPLMVQVSSAGEARSVHRTVPCAVSPLQTAIEEIATSKPCRPPPGLAEVSQVEVISTLAWHKYQE